MAETRADKLTAVINGEEQYGLELDSALRTIAKTFSAEICLKWFSRIDDADPSFRENVMAMAAEARKVEKLYELVPAEEQSGLRREERSITVSLRLRFRNADACYYQFNLFPPDLDYILGMSRKREGDSQVMLLTIPSREHLTEFLELCRSNAHFLGAEMITEEEFHRARSDGV